MSISAAFVVPHPPIILPEIGQGEQEKIQATIDAYREAMCEAAELRPDTVVLTSPHALMYADYFHISPGEKAEGDFGTFGHPEVRVEAEYDTEYVAELGRQISDASLAAGTMGERKPELDHGTMIPLRFLQEYLPDVRLVRIGLSGLPPMDHYRLGQCIARTAEKLGRRVVFIASGDLSHKLLAEGPYGFAPQGPEFDARCTAALAQGDFLSLLQMDANFCEAAAECGLRSFWIMAGALDKKAVEAKLLSYEGPFGVGYGVASLFVQGEDGQRDFGTQFEAEKQCRLAARKAQEDPFVKLARHSLETYVHTGSYALLPANLPAELLSRRAGAFVSLKKDGQLRGCIGTIAATQKNIAEEILYNAVSAGVHDPRFSPVMPEELSELVYSVDILGEPEHIDDERKLDVKRYGVIVEYAGRRGLLLPDLAGVDTPAKQIGIARGKAGIPSDAPVELWRFEVVRHD